MCEVRRNRSSAENKRSWGHRCNVGAAVKYLTLIWSGIWRKPGRAILILLQVLIAFLLYGLLQGFKGGIDQVIAQTRADILVVHSLTVTANLAAIGVVWALAMGLIGGLLPALRAAGLSVTSALRAN